MLNKSCLNNEIQAHKHVECVRAHARAFSRSMSLLTIQLLDGDPSSELHQWLLCCFFFLSQLYIYIYIYIHTYYMFIGSMCIHT